MPPKLVSPYSGSHGRHRKVAYRAGHDISKRQTVGLRTQNFRFDVRYCEARRIRMKPQRLAHSGILARGVAYDRR
jgi:hypothetical protein